MGGDPSAPTPRSGTQEIGQTLGILNRQEIPSFNNYAAHQPLLAGSTNLALQGQSQIQPGLDYLSQIIASHGALTPQETRDVTQQTEAGFAQRGNLYGNQALGADILNRDSAKWNKFLQATGAYQGAEAGAINPALQTQQTATGTYATLLDPLLSYQQDLNNTNYNAQAAANIAGSNKSSGLIGGGLSAVGTVAGAAL